MTTVPIVDLFAGPGGLNHGFSSFRSSDIKFKVRLSIEKEQVAWRTLHLRAFLSQFVRAPDDYYKYLRGEEGYDRVFLKGRYPEQWRAAEMEARNWTLGDEQFSIVSNTIREAVGSTSEWVLLGGPPCQAYSLAGRSRMKNLPRFSKDERHRLYREYLKIVAVHEPAVFVMENVKGILSATQGSTNASRSIFSEILEDLREPGMAVCNDSDVSRFLPETAKRRTYKIYSFVTTGLSPELLNPSDYVIRSEDWGVPQKRHRVILLGVRSDIPTVPRTLADLFMASKTNIEFVIGRLPKLRSRLSDGTDNPRAWLDAIHKITDVCYAMDRRDAVLQQVLRSNAERLKVRTNTGAPYLHWNARPAALADWLWDARLGGVIQHESRSHMHSDLLRYFFAATVAAETGSSPKLRAFPEALLPDHTNVKEREDGLRKADFEDRFRVQLRGHPATTITSHIAKDGHYYIHYDPMQCRSLTVREAARIQTFPDSYFFEGNRTQQYQQVGNAVPPLLALKLAHVVADTMRRSKLSQQSSIERMIGAVAVD